MYVLIQPPRISVANLMKSRKISNFRNSAMPAGDRISEANMPMALLGRGIGEAHMPGASPEGGDRRQSRYAEGITIEIWQVMGLQSGTAPRKLGAWMDK